MFVLLACGIFAWILAFIDISFVLVELIITVITVFVVISAGAIQRQTVDFKSEQATKQIKASEVIVAEY